MNPKCPRPDFEMESDEGPIYGEIVTITLEDPSTNNDDFHVYIKKLADELNED